MKLFPASESTSTSKASKSSILRKNLQVEKLALELKIAKQKCEEEIRLLRSEAERRTELLQLKRRVEKKRNLKWPTKMPLLLRILIMEILTI